MVLGGMASGRGETWGRLWLPAGLNCTNKFVLMLRYVPEDVEERRQISCVVQLYNTRLRWPARRVPRASSLWLARNQKFQ